MSQSYSTEMLERGLKTALLQRVAAETPRLVGALAEVVESDGEDEKYEHLNDAPQMSEFKGARKHTALTGRGYTLTNTVYDAAVLIGRDDLRNNRSGSVQLRINQLASTVAAFPNKLIIDTLTTNGNCFDGTAFFGNSHPVLGDESGTQDNLLAGTGTTTAQIQADLASAVSALKNFENTAGEPFHGDGFSSLVVVCPPALEFNMREALGATIISNTTNVNAGIADLIVSPRLTATDANDWYLFVTDPGRKPLIYQRNQEIEVDVTAEGSEMWKNLRQAQFGASMSAAAGYGFWQSAIKTTNT